MSVPRFRRGSWASPTGGRRPTGGVTVCWAAKGGSGTTVVVAALALTMERPVMVVDLAGDLPAVFGLPEPGTPGVHDWMRSDADAAQLADLAVDVVPDIELLPSGTTPVARDHPRWRELAGALTADQRAVVVDAGTGPPPAGLVDDDARSLLVTRGCYLALRRAAVLDHRPSGVLLIGEPGHALGGIDVEIAVGAPLIATVRIDPAVARAVDSGLLATRLPRAISRELRGAIA
jgi:Cellulose biosynthesis protein BcsQ